MAWQGELGYCLVLILFTNTLGFTDAEVSSLTTWNVVAPDSAPFIVDERERSRGPINISVLEDLFNDSASQTRDVFILKPKKTWKLGEQASTNSDLTWLENGALSCIRDSMKAKELNSTDISGRSLCLFPSTEVSFRQLETLTSSLSKTPVITKQWIRLKPVLLTRCTKRTCPNPTRPGIWNAIYFLRVFHSSVWSMILLFLCTTAALFYIFEQSHPLRLGRRQPKPPDPNRFNLLDCFMYTTLAMVLRPFHKTPRSWAGLVLSVFWNGFCIICLIAYAIGTSRLLLQTLPEGQSGNEVVVMPRNATVIACEPHQIWCSQLRDKTGYRIVYFSQRITSSSVDSWRSADTLLTDHLTAHYLMAQGYQPADAQSGQAVRWVRASLLCPRTVPGFRLADLELGFATASPEAAWRFNKYILDAKNSGFLGRLIQRWNGALNNDYEICLADTGRHDGLQIRLLKMNGPIVFIIVGSITALLTHGAQCIFLSFPDDDEKNAADDDETLLQGRKQTFRSNQSEQ